VKPAPAAPAAGSATARDLLLADVLDHARQHGLADVSLRSLAAAIGTSHRMLIYHFGSREGLQAAVVAAVEGQQRDLLAAITGAPSADPAGSMRELWTALADPGMHEAERLFFETVAAALRGRPGTEGLRRTLVEPWLEAAADAAGSLGLPAGSARVEARVGMALVRGLLLDLLATGDRAGVDAAIEHFIAGWLPPSTPDHGSGPDPAPGN
jgi:AcrR family transcriptional regulator